MTIWGNHSATQYPDIFHAEIDGKNAAEVVNDQAWLENDFIPTVQKRGAAIIEARGASSAASAAVATIDAARDWLPGTPEGDWLSMAVCSDGSYDVPEGLISSFPVTTSNGEWEIVQGLEIDDFSRARIDAQRRRARRGARRRHGTRPHLSPAAPERPARSVRSQRGVRVPPPSCCPEPPVSGRSGPRFGGLTATRGRRGLRAPVSGGGPARRRGR